MNSFGQYISEKIKNIAGNYINPATEETLQSISQKKIGDSFWLKNVLSGITKLTFDNSGQLRALVSGFSGLIPLSKYYISNIKGLISTVAGTISRSIGLAVNSNGIYISSTYYPGTNITKP